MEHAVEAPQPPISLSKFLDEFKKSYSSEGTVPFYFDKKLSFNEDVKASCSLELLASPDDNLITNFEPGTELQRPQVPKPQPNKHIPKIYTAISEHKASSRRNPFSRSQYSYRLVPEPKSNGAVILEEFELQITARIYRPPRTAHRDYKLERPVFAEEFLCLGSNYLSELRDKINCVCNGRRLVDISEQPDAELPVLDTDPAYFFIYDTFYNDTRNPNNCDYSQTVLNWAKTAHGLQQKQFQVASMEQTRFIDLTVSLGAPIQYLHHGACEHLFVFSQVEVLRPHTKYLDRSLYPLMRALNSFNRRACFLCGQRAYHFIVEQSTRQLYDPSYLCRSCFYSFHYVDGKKVGNFKAYRLYDHTGERDDDESESQDKQHSDSDNSFELEEAT
ncbi:snRNA-activating protein complex subunit 3 [Drosophila sulfurigaster albostrigata]|uniref:snRNA-activating protein complex subunit 3 n=1 Tax=Drosophila sulfurigaster albostrigata TaxID=89887 RepID=UPI002D21B367|nr:snRNA-activating protein complex subunit 3 [Drosophila sulfurigaster albostrigata]